MRFCVDSISVYNDNEITKYVVIKRLTFPCGLAFPGGKIEPDEDKDTAIVREVKEETGLTLIIRSWLPRVYDKEGRDSRFPSLSYVAYGEAIGVTVNERKKTEVILLTQEEMFERSHEFVFDHFEMFLDYHKHTRT